MTWDGFVFGVAGVIETDPAAGRLLDDYPLGLRADGPDPGHIAAHTQRTWYAAAREQPVTDQ